MELLERYLHAVRGYLLARRRDDIVRELSGNILSQMEDQEAELGRPLNKSEQAAILKQHGHPVVAAARYMRLPMPQLVGPVLFPLYWYALQAMLVAVAAFHLVLAVVLALGSGSVLSGFVHAWSSFWLWVLVGVGALTIGFGLIEYFGGGKIPFTATFNPHELPEIKKPAPPHSKALLELVMGGLFLVGWPVFLHLPASAFVKSLPVHLASSWRHFEIPMLLVAALGTASAFVALFRPQQTLLRAVFRLASNIAGVIVLYLFLLTGEFIVPDADAVARFNQPVQAGAHVLTAGQVANYAAAIGPFIALIVFFCDTLAEVVRLLRPRRQSGVVTHESNGIL